MDARIILNSGDISLEGLYTERSDAHAAIIAHPHPLYGGDMHNPVVAAIAEAYQNQGWSTLRFNFRGVGASGGRFDDGQGEQEDLQGVIDHLQSKGFQQIDLSGYSFGAWVISHWTQHRPHHGHRIVLVSPPVAAMDFTAIGTIHGLAGVITGDRDDIAPPMMIEPQLSQWQPGITLQQLENTDHFYGRSIYALQSALEKLITET